MAAGKRNFGSVLSKFEISAGAKTTVQLVGLRFIIIKKRRKQTEGQERGTNLYLSLE